MTTELTDLGTTALPARIAGFPFPFVADTYRYTTNVEPAGSPVATAAGSWGAHVLDVDEYYTADAAECRALLAADQSRCQVLPHMVPATWDAMLELMRRLADARPDAFELRAEGSGRWFWRNDLLGLEQRFTFGDAASLPEEPLRYIAPQVQDDVLLLDERAGALWADAGAVTAAADWSLNFDVGMNVLEIHGPVPRVRSERVITRAHDFMLRRQPGEPFRRTNWTMTVGRRLDTSTETYPSWGPDRRLVLEEDLGGRLYLRVEVQHLLRLPMSASVMFLIRTYLLSLEDVARVPQWRDRLAAVLEELPDDMADYKGLTRYRRAAVEWLRTAQPVD